MTDAKLLTDEQVREFIANGFLRLEPDVDPALHRDIDERLRYALEHESWHGNNIVSRIPEIHEVLRSPVVHGALVSLAGPRYFLHPHRAVHRSTPVADARVELDPAANAPRMGKGSTAGSAWHQDAQSPLARARHHVPRYLIGFYFPHDTPLEMGPTRIQAGSYLYANPVEPHGVVLPEGVTAGTFLLVHFDMVHAGFPNRAERDRNMVKFVFARTEHPREPTWDNRDPAWRRPAGCIPEFDLPEVWSYIWHWLRGHPAGRANDLAPPANIANLNHPDQVTRLRSTYALAAQTAVPALVGVLAASAGQHKHERVLARDDKGNPLPRDDVRGYPRIWNERAIVMEDAAYALAASGAQAVPALTELVAHNDPWVQINAAFALGEIGPAASAAFGAVGALLNSPHQQVVRQALDALGAIGCGLAPTLDRIEALMSCSNPDWQSAEVQRGWTGEDQVRLNAAFALLNAVNSGQALDRIETILLKSLGDRNGYVAAVAAEGLVRIGTASAVAGAVRYLTDRRWDDTLLPTKPY